MKIAFANAYYDPSVFWGSNTHIHQFISNAVLLGHEVWSWPGDQHPISHKLPANRILRMKALRNADVIYYRMENSPPPSILISSFPFRELLGSPRIVWEFNTTPEYGRVIGIKEDEIRNSIERFRFFGRDCQLAICVSDLLAEYVREVIGIKKTVVVPNGSDPELFRPSVNSAEKEDKCKYLNVLWMGSANLDWHNLNLLVNTASYLANSFQNVKVNFHLIGPEFVLERDLSPNMNYHGPKKYEELPDWLMNMDIGLVLYKSGVADYGSPLKIFDYMASGLMIIGTPHPQVCDIYDEIGQPRDLMVNTGNHEELARILIELSENRELVREFGRAGRQLVTEKFNWKRAIRDTLRAIDSIL